MAQIKNGKVQIHKVEINVNDVLSWIEKQGRCVTSVELRDQFNWPLREIARRLMRLLAEQSKVIIANHPIRKNSIATDFQIGVSIQNRTIHLHVE
jgi:hypothetical protein